MLLIALCFVVNTIPAVACSAYKITSHGKTMVGSNYDSWFLDPVIWFETNGYGASFSGARREGNGSIAPQTGLNEHGLAFVTLAAAPVPGGGTPAWKKPITNRSAYLKDILHTCRTVEEVKAYVEQYDRSVLFDEVFLYADSLGHYLVVEPYTVTLGTDPSYVQGNFCPSTISDLSTIKQQRYINGVAFVQNGLDSSLSFCTRMSDTMHVCRPKAGDGTLLTSILDLGQQVVHLYFYHDYTQRVSINLKEELAKGDHRLNITSLFPPCEEYQQFLAFKTPATSPMVRSMLAGSAAFFGLSALVLFIGFFRGGKTRFRFVKLLLVPLNLALAFYMLVLLLKDIIFYYPAPYQDYEFSILNIVAYLPFLLLCAIIPLLVVNRKLFAEKSWGRAARTWYTINTGYYIVMIALFTYWGLYSVF